MASGPACGRLGGGSQRGFLRWAGAEPADPEPTPCPAGVGRRAGRARAGRYGGAGRVHRHRRRPAALHPPPRPPRRRHRPRRPRRPRSTTAVSDLLGRRAAALVAGDEPAYAATVADRSAAAGRRQLDSFGAARALRVSRLEVGEPVVDPVETGPSTGTTGPSRATAQVDVRYRVDDLDRGDRVARLEYDLVRSDAGWQVEAERPVGAGATAPWVAMPTLRVRRGEHAVVAGTVPGTRLAEHAAVVDRAVPDPAQAVVGHAVAGARAGAVDQPGGRRAARAHRVRGRTGGRDHRGATRRCRHRDRRPRRARPHGVRPAHRERA